MLAFISTPCKLERKKKHFLLWISFIMIISWQKFLSQYYYISSTRSGNHDVETAIRRFQEFTGLSVTGELNEQTIAQMKKPRCGMADVDEEGRVKRYKTGSKWSKKDLTYFVEHGADLPQDLQDKIFAKALKFGSDVSGLSFSQASSASSADIKIRWAQCAPLFVQPLECLMIDMRFPYITGKEKKQPVFTLFEKMLRIWVTTDLLVKGS